jgi:hypothetical protein
MVGNQAEHQKQTETYTDWKLDLQLNSLSDL